MAGYRGILMGCSRPYWLGILRKIYDIYGMGEWSWEKVKTNLPEISNSDLRRLNCSNWFVKGKTYTAKKRNWKLDPEVETLLNDELAKQKKNN
jgi:hypothetical protein